MNKLIAFCIVSFFVTIAFANQLPLDEQQSVMPTDQSAVPAEMTLPECKEKLANCGKEVSDIQAKLDEADKKMAEKCKVGKKQAAAIVAVGTADKIGKDAEKIPEEQKKAIQEKARAVIQSTSADEALERFEALSDRIDEVKDEILNRIKDLESGQIAQDAKIDDHGKRIQTLEDEKFVTVFVEGMAVVSSIMNGGGAGVGTSMRLGDTKGTWRGEAAFSIFGGDKKNAINLQGNLSVSWASKDLDFLRYKVGGVAGSMMLANDPGKFIHNFGGLLVEVEARWKDYAVALRGDFGVVDEKVGEHLKFNFLGAGYLVLRIYMF